MKIFHFDVVIVGAGVVGLTLACVLAEQGIKTLVLDNKEPQHHWDPYSYDLRVSAITRASQHILRSLNVWEHITEMGVSPYQQMTVWDGSGGGEIQFDSHAIGETDLGHIIENRVLQLALFKKWKQFSSAECLCPANITSLQCDADVATLTLKDDYHITTKLIVGADGAHSRIRELAGFVMREHDYQHHALVTTIETELPHEQTARQRFLQSEQGSGTLAFLPLRDAHTCSIVWAMAPEKIVALKQLDEVDFKIQLASAFDHRLGKIKTISERLTFPLQMRHAKSYVQSRIALIGDAAHTLHPLAGQGMNLGILDAACLAEVLLKARKQKYDIGELSVLRRYERWRKGHNLTMITAMELFKRLFGSDFPPLRSLRNIGLSLVDKISPLKYTIVRHAMGLVGDLPLAARFNVSLYRSSNDYTKK